jgi:mono/diheme cytochrome c family protein
LVVPAFVSLKAVAEDEHGTGKGSYTRFCADCHGTDGKGNGPKASPDLKPADLTQLAMKNGGKFPTLRIEQILEGKIAVPGHGSPERPVWGKNFNEPSSQAGETAARERIGLLIRYLKSIQEK